MREIRPQEASRATNNSQAPASQDQRRTVVIVSAIPSTDKEYRKFNAALYTILHDDPAERDFHIKILRDATDYILRKIFYDYGKETKIFLYDTNQSDKLGSPFLKASDHKRFFLKIPLKLPLSVMQRYISDLNEEFNLNRRLGLFTLEKSKKGYQIYFNPNEMSANQKEYLNNDRFLSRALAVERYPDYIKINEEQILALALEDDLVQRVLDKLGIEAPVTKPFGTTKGLSIWSRDEALKRALRQEIKVLNTKYNVEKRAGLFRCEAFDGMIKVCFTLHQTNKGYQELKQKGLPKNILELEDKYGVIFVESK